MEFLTKIKKRSEHCADTALPPPTGHTATVLSQGLRLNTADTDTAYSRPHVGVPRDFRRYRINEGTLIVVSAMVSRFQSEK